MVLKAKYLQKAYKLKERGEEEPLMKIAAALEKGEYDGNQEVDLGLENLEQASENSQT